MQARLRPKGQLFAASAALGAIAWPYDKTRFGCALLPTTGSEAVGALKDATPRQSLHDMRTVQDCAFLQWQSVGGENKKKVTYSNANDDGGGLLSSASDAILVDVLAAASRTAVEVFFISRESPGKLGGAGGGDDIGSGVSVLQARALALPQGIGAICSIVWQSTASSITSSVPTLLPPTSPTSQLLVVTKSCALLYVIGRDLSQASPPVRVPIPVPGAPTIAAFAPGELALCGGGEFSLHRTDLLITPDVGERCGSGESTCLCADLAAAAPSVSIGMPRALAHMNTLSSLTTDLFVCLTDSPVALPFASGKRDRPLNEALHMMQTMRNRKKDSALAESSDKPAAVSAANTHSNGNATTTVPGATPEASAMPKGRKNFEGDQVIDLIGGFNRGSGLPSGNPGGTLGALMSIARPGGRPGKSALLHTANMLSVSSSSANIVNSSSTHSSTSSLPCRSNNTGERPVPAPCLHIYRLKSRRGEETKKTIMRVSLHRVPLVNGDIMAVCSRTGLIAVGSGTCGRIVVFKPSMPGYRLEVFKKIDLAELVTESKQGSLDVGAEASFAAASMQSSTPTFSVRCKGVAFVGAELWILAGVKVDQGAGFFSAGAASFICELHRFCFPKLMMPRAPVPQRGRIQQALPVASAQIDTKVSSGPSSNNTMTNTIIDAIESLRVHIDSRLDRIEGSLLMHSQRLSKIEREVAASR